MKRFKNGFKADCTITEGDSLVVEFDEEVVTFIVYEDDSNSSAVLSFADVLELVEVVKEKLTEVDEPLGVPMIGMQGLHELAKSLGVKLGESLPTKVGSVIRVKDGSQLMLRAWNDMNGTGEKYAWTNGLRDVEVSEFGNDWELII